MFLVLSSHTGHLSGAQRTSGSARRGRSVRGWGTGLGLVWEEGKGSTRIRLRLQGRPTAGQRRWGSRGPGMRGQLWEPAEGAPGLLTQRAERSCLPVEGKYGKESRNPGARDKVSTRPSASSEGQPQPVTRSFPQDVRLGRASPIPQASKCSVLPSRPRHRWECKLVRPLQTEQTGRFLRHLRPDGRVVSSPAFEHY